MKELIYYLKTDKAEYFIYHTETPLTWDTEVIRRKAGYPAFLDKSILRRAVIDSWRINGSFEVIMERIMKALQSEAMRLGELTIEVKWFSYNLHKVHKTIIER